MIGERHTLSRAPSDLRGQWAKAFGADPNHRRWAESFGSDAERYDRARPRYPEALIERIVAASPGRDFLDVGCGTGIASRQFAAAGATVLGIDVDGRMADVARASGLEVEVAAFEDWDPAGRTFDAVVSAQTWHWIDPGAGASKAARALAPSGRLAVFWNVGRPPQEVAEAFGAVYRRVMPDLPYLHAGGRSALDAHEAGFTRAVDGMVQAGAFGEPEEWRFAWERSYSRDEWLDQVTTHGDHSQFPAAKLDEVLEGIGAAIDARGGAFTMGYTAVAIIATRQA
jgi:SAM-dependent methyltransferase